MRQRIIAGCAVLLVVAGSVALHSQSRSSGAGLYEGARLIVGDGSTFETGALLVQGGPSRASEPAVRFRCRQERPA